MTLCELRVTHLALKQSSDVATTFSWPPKVFLPFGGPSVQFSRSVVSDSLWPHELQHAGPPCPSPTPGVHSNERIDSYLVETVLLVLKHSEPNPQQYVWILVLLFPCRTCKGYLVMKMPEWDLNTCLHPNTNMLCHPGFMLRRHLSHLRTRELSLMSPLGLWYYWDEQSMACRHMSCSAG